jgi:hypothetical protein
MIADKTDEILANAGTQGADFWTLMYIYDEEPSMTMTAIRKFTKTGMEEYNVMKFG